MDSRSLKLTIQITADTDLEKVKKRLRTLQNSLRAQLSPEELVRITESVFNEDQSGVLLDGRLIEKNRSCHSDIKRDSGDE